MGVFATIWFIYNIDQIPSELLFDEEMFQHNPGFVELWERNTPLGNLSKQL
jgi:hypothetical protein